MNSNPTSNNAPIVPVKPVSLVGAPVLKKTGNQRMLGAVIQDRTLGRPLHTDADVVIENTAASKAPSIALGAAPSAPEPGAGATTSAASIKSNKSTKSTASATQKQNKLSQIASLIGTKLSNLKNVVTSGVAAVLAAVATGLGKVKAAISGLIAKLPKASKLSLPKVSLPEVSLPKLSLFGSKTNSAVDKSDAVSTTGTFYTAKEEFAEKTK